MEQWRPVKDWEDFYAVSDLGRVMRTAPGKKTYAGKIMNPSCTAAGYPMAMMTSGKRREARLVHRMVAQAFLPAPDDPNKMYVAHKNGCRTDNRLENLYWATPSENNFDQVLHGTAPGRNDHRKAPLSDDDVRQIRQDRRAAPAIAEEYGVSVSAVSNVRRRLSYKHVAPQPGDYVATMKAKNFTDSQIRAIRADPRDNSVVAREYEVSANTIRDIRRFRFYTWVKD
jgi:hypothetical protein